ncbi:hypothetical protein ACFY7Y_03965 [Streptomyces virginiae]|uniref:hypothetical protein n=1 Tax=Streptomyces virginiae TaxID=1961 RepID=UPI00369D0009
MQHLGKSDSTHTVARDLTRLTADSSGRQATGPALVVRPANAALAALTTPARRGGDLPALDLPGRGQFPLDHHPRRDVAGSSRGP